jgi:hypothetical protein
VDSAFLEKASFKHHGQGGVEELHSLQGQLQGATYNYTVYIIKSLGEEWLVLKDNAGADNPRGPRGLRKLPEKKEYNSLAAAKRRGGGEPEQCASDATRGCMENASLNTGANCKRYICTVLRYIM